MFKSDYFQALDDYRKARRGAAVQEILARLSGDTDDVELLSYDEVRHKLKAIEKSSETLEEIPLDSIVGSVGRYHDFTRKFLPKSSIDRTRWARVMATSQGLAGLPPIDVYRIGEVYFVKDGNHRVSVARQMGSDLIQAYVTEVESKVDLSPDTKPDDLIIKAEQVDFLDRTRLDQTKPDSDLTATKAGAYPTLLEHIDVHRYYQGVEQQREVPFPEAAESWYENVYKPVVKIIRNRGLLEDFPERTSVDLYLWTADHRAAIREEIGWEIGLEAAISDLSIRHSKRRRSFSRFLGTIISWLIPDVLEPGPPAGSWREKLAQMTVLEHIFNDLIIALDDSQTAWNALDMALVLSKMENSRVHGIHVHGDLSGNWPEEHISMEEEFNSRCSGAGISGYEFKVVEGDIAKILLDQARFADLIVIPLNHPPDNRPISRISSGISTLIRTCPVPVLTVPSPPSQLHTLLIAYDGSPKAREALYLAAYLGTQYGVTVNVLTSRIDAGVNEDTLVDARNYLDQYPVNAKYILTDDPISDEISNRCLQDDIDLILIGGYARSAIVDVMLGSAVDQVLREVPLPVLVCR